MAYSMRNVILPPVTTTLFFFGRACLRRDDLRGYLDRGSVYQKQVKSGADLLYQYFQLTVRRGEIEEAAGVAAQKERVRPKFSFVTQIWLRSR